MSKPQVPTRPSVSAGQSFQYTHQDVDTFRADLQAKRRHKTRLTDWIATEPFWYTRLGPGWVGQKVLGRGGQGIVGLWSYEGPENPHPVKEVAVKQASSKLIATGERALEAEARYLKLFAKFDTQQIIKMYGKWTRLIQGTWERMFSGFSLNTVNLEI
jgi:hypothetical protein